MMMREEPSPQLIYLVLALSLPSRAKIVQRKCVLPDSTPDISLSLSVMSGFYIYFSCKLFIG